VLYQLSYRGVSMASLADAPFSVVCALWQAP